MECLNIGIDAENILELVPSKFLTEIDSVAVIGHIKCLVKPTGKIYESDCVQLFCIKNDKIQKFQEFFDTYIAGGAFRKKL